MGRFVLGLATALVLSCSAAFAGEGTVVSFEQSNRHRGADQWLCFFSGVGEAVVNGKRQLLQEGTLLLIEAGEQREICNTGNGPLRTLNVQAPTSYTLDGKELPSGSNSLDGRRTRQ